MSPSASARRRARLRASEPRRRPLVRAQLLEHLARLDVGRAIALRGGLRIPIPGKPQILHHAIAVLVHAGEDVARAFVALLGGALVPLGRLLEVLGRTTAE